MMLLAILLLVGTFLYQAVCGRQGGLPGMLLKAMGVLAVVAGIGLLVQRSGRYDDAPRARPQRVQLDVHSDDNLELGRLLLGAEPLGAPSAVYARSMPSRALVIVLGSGLIMLGAMLFGRDRTRPFVLKAVTWLGVGMILFSTVNFFVDLPSTNRRAPHVSHQVSSLGIEHEVRVPKDAASMQRARRPGLRPLRPASDNTEFLVLPRRAGEIPVEVELEQVVIASEDAGTATTKTETVKAETAQSQPAEAEAAASEVNEAGQHREDSAAPKEPQASPAPTEAAQAATLAAPAVAATPINEPRPAWVDAPPALQGSVYSIVVNSGPYVSVPECQHAIESLIQATANHYIDEYLGDEQAAKLVDMPLAYLNRNLRKADYLEIIQSQSVGPMYQLHARLDFDDRARAEFQRRWRDALIQDRLWYTGGGAALVLALLATFYGYLRLDLKTGAAQRGRLQLAATLVALIAVGGALLARWAVAF